MKTKVYFIFVWVILFVFSAGCGGDRRSSKPDSGRGFKVMREKMVETQIKGRGVKNERVLSAMLKVERHRFVPKEYESQAYADQPLPIGEGQTISQPYIVALMTELLDLKGEETVLEVGTGSGYQAAILAELAKEVYTIEIVEPLASSSKALLFELGYRNIQVKAGDGYLGWPDVAPFDAIIVTCAPDHIPKPLLDPKQARMGRQITVDVGSRKTGRNCHQLVSLPQTEGIPLPPIV